MRAIWKYELEVTDIQEIKVPKRGRFIAAGMQGEQLCVWAEVWTQNEVEDRTIIVYGTGHPFAGGNYVGTVIAPPFVWHVYEAKS